MKLLLAEMDWGYSVIGETGYSIKRHTDDFYCDFKQVSAKD